MKGLLAVFVVSLALAGFVHAQDVEMSSDAPTEAPKTTAQVTTKAPPTESSTTQPDTTAAGTTQGDVTTAGQTTIAPPHTTTAPPEPQAGHWYINDTTGGYPCVLTDMAAKFTLNYTDTNGKTLTKSFNLPKNAVASGSCTSNATQTIMLTFMDDWMLSLEYSSNNKQFSIKSATFNYNATKALFPNISSTEANVMVKTKFNLTDVKASSENSYLCKSDQTQDLKAANVTKGTIEISDLQVQAFRTAKDEWKFGDAQECPADSETSNIVPIAVGAALAALVVIVLIAYLISRNRNKGGYESV